MESLIGEYVPAKETTFEKNFADLVGAGQAVSFAAGRMGFYALMKILGIGVGDEVIIQGHTCSVMPNAIWRTKAKPVFSDIDLDTFGSSAEEIEKLVSKNTRMIVAQHSFGIPCEIEAIKELSKSKGIFLLEDCAITLGSKINGKQIGNFGDAALFSTDHSKPLNTFIGGLIYTQNEELYSNLKKTQVVCDDLPINRQKSIWKKFLFERQYYNPSNYSKSFFVDIANRIIGKGKDAYLTNDYGKRPSTSYPYPAKLPLFLTQLGIFELDRWKDESKKRKQLLSQFLSLSEIVGINNFLPKAYYDKNREIIPLRFVFTHPKGEKVKIKMSRNIDVRQFWFDKPIVACKEPSELGYIYGSCQNSEKTSRKIINWPCVFNKSSNRRLLEYFKKVFT